MVFLYSRLNYFHVNRGTINCKKKKLQAKTSNFEFFWIISSELKFELQPLSLNLNCISPLDIFKCLIKYKVTLKTNNDFENVNATRSLSLFSSPKLNWFNLLGIFFWLKLSQIFCD